MNKRVVLFTFLLAILITGCGQIGNSISAADLDRTVAAAVITRVAGLPTVTPTPSFTPLPPTATATATPIPPTETATIQSSGTPATNTPYPYISWTPSQCDKSAFMADLDIIDYSFVYPGTNFTKTWRIKNIGTCTWTTKYRFQYISGNPMGADTIYLPRAVAPGDTIDIALNMHAPEIDEDYSNFWRLRNTAGEIFGTTFYVAIEVSKARVSVTPSSTLKPPTATLTSTQPVTPTNTFPAPTEAPSATEAVTPTG